MFLLDNVYFTCYNNLCINKKDFLMSNCTVVKIKHITNVFIGGSRGYKLLKFDKDRCIDVEDISYSYGQDMLWKFNDNPEAKIETLDKNIKYRSRY